MPTIEGYEGVWCTYDYDSGPYLIAVFKDVVPAARSCAQNGYGKVGFLRFDMDFTDSITWWVRRRDEPDEVGPGPMLIDDPNRFTLKVEEKGKGELEYLGRQLAVLIEELVQVAEGVSRAATSAE